MLSAYITRVNQLMQYPVATPPLYATADITGWVNQARGQVAGEQCIQLIGTVNTVVGQRNYNFSAINLGTPSSTGVQGVLNVSRINYGIASGQKRVHTRPWEWVDQFGLNNPVPVNGPPQMWAQLGQGSAGIGSITGQGGGTQSTGNFYLDPPPDAIYTLYCVCACYPISLAADTDPEAVPYLWSDSIPYFAAYLALLSAQAGQRRADAQRMLELYNQFVERARKYANPDRLRPQYRGATDPTTINKLGLRQGAGGGG